nr:ST.12 [Starmerella bombicola]
MSEEASSLIRVAAVSLLPLQFGLHMGILNAPMDYMGCNGVESESQDCIKGWSPALPSSIYAFGGLLGSAAAGSAINKYGLNRVYMLCAFIFIAGSLLVASSTTMAQMVIGRLVVGTAAGGSIVVCPILVNKLSPARYRGQLGTMTQLTTNLGIVIAQLLGAILAETHWRRIMWIAFFLSGVIAGLGSAIIQSPQAKATSTEVESDPEAISPQINIGVLELFTQTRYRYLLITATSIFAVQQLSGINAIIQYGVRILVDVMPDHAKRVNLLLSSHNLAMTILVTPIMGRIGRKKLLLTSLGLMSLSSAAMAFGLVRGLVGFTAGAAFCTIAAFAAGIGPIPFMYISEIAPVEAVSAAQSLGTVSSWISTFAVLASFPALQNALGASVFYCFSVCTLTAALFYWKWLTA